MGTRRPFEVRRTGRELLADKTGALFTNKTVTLFISWCLSDQG